MKMMMFMSVTLIAGLAVVTGCTPQAAAPPAKETAAKTEQPATNKKVQHDHSGWWCDEHGVPEEQCSQCSSKVAAEFQKKGDWCAEHDRAKSQCFICDPKLKVTFAAQYRAKEGKEPPALDDQGEKEEKKEDPKS